MSLGQKVNENQFLAESGHTLTYPRTADIAQYEVTYVGVAKFGALSGRVTKCMDGAQNWHPLTFWPKLPLKLGIF